MTYSEEPSMLFHLHTPYPSHPSVPLTYLGLQVFDRFVTVVSNGTRVIPDESSDGFVLLTTTALTYTKK